MRAFLAVTCGEQLARAVTTVLDGWRAGPGGRLPVRWTGARTWHLTLQFLGDWPPERLEDLQRALAQVRDVSPFTVQAGGLGAFPDLKGPRVLFLHMAAAGRAADLAHRVRTVVGETWPDGPQDNRPYRGHLTLARIKTKLSRSDIKLLRELQFGELPPVPVTGFSLLASELRPAGPRYTELAYFPLRK